MANSRRIYKDNRGNMFLPMNVEGGSWSDNFMTTPKLIVLVSGILSLVVMIVYLNSNSAEPSGYVVLVGLWVVIFQLLLRYVIFEERYYYRMYKQLKNDETTKPSLFWGIADISGNKEAVLTYLDGKLAIIMKMERDTITGKNKDFEEIHYDALSDMYKEIVDRGYSFVQLNVMEQGVNDSRLSNLDKLVDRATNPNVKTLTEMKVNYIKSITKNTLYDNDYIMIYTKDLNKKDRIVEDAVEIAYRAMNGGFIGFNIMGVTEIVELVKEDFGVRYFDIGDAMVGMYGNTEGATPKVLSVVEIEYADGESQELDMIGRNIIQRMTSNAIRGTAKISSISIKEALHRENRNDEFIGVTLEEKRVENSPEPEKPTTQKLKKQKVKAWGRKRGSTSDQKPDNSNESIQPVTGFGVVVDELMDEEDEFINF